MTAETLPNLTNVARRLLHGVADSRESVSLGSLAADLDRSPPDALALLYRLVHDEAIPVQATYVLACEDCGQSLSDTTGLAAWALAGAAFTLPCKCGALIKRSGDFLDLIIGPAESVPVSRPVAQVAEPVRTRSKAVKSVPDLPKVAEQLSFFDLDD